MKVILLMAMTLDGKIALDGDHFPDWTGPEDKKLFVRLTKEAGALIMGSKTYDTIGKPLPGRLNVVMTRQESRVKNQESIENLQFTNEAPKMILEKLAQQGFEKVVLAGGAQINTLFLEEGLINEFHITISPLIFGKGLGLFAEGVGCDLQLVSCEKIGEDLIYTIYKPLAISH